VALEQLQVSEIVRQAVSKSVDIPEFQREFVWDAEQVKLLAESLYRDYPVGSFLVWDCAEYREAKVAEGSEASLWIVDGQQRTTALCLLLGMKPYWWDTDKWNKALARYDIMVNVVPEEADRPLEFALANPVRRNDPRWIKIRDILSCQDVENLTDLADRVVTAVRVASEDTKRLFGRVLGNLQELWQIRKRHIPVVKIAHEVEDVAEIFARLNTRGTRVKEADTFLALAAARNPGWVREGYLPFQEDLADRGWDLEAGIFIRTMTGLETGQARLRDVPKDFWGPDQLLPAWRKAKSAISRVVKHLAQKGVSSVYLLPSTNALVPLFILHHRFGTNRDFCFDRTFYWFLLASRDGRYGSAAITTLTEDVRTVRDAESLDSALAALSARLRVDDSIDEKEFLDRYDRADSHFNRLMLYLTLFSKGAIDWADGTRIGYDNTGSPVAAGLQPQWHHIYPRRLLRKADFPEDEIQALANITVLNQHTNTAKLSARAPWDYIKELHIAPETLASHMVPESFRVDHADPELEKVWAIEHFHTFLVERATELAKEANALLGKLKGA
jgi:hypothetical protein